MDILENTILDMPVWQYHDKKKKRNTESALLIIRLDENSARAHCFRFLKIPLDWGEQDLNKTIILELSGASASMSMMKLFFFFLFRSIMLRLTRDYSIHAFVQLVSP